jgi:hypothetical protein
VVIRFGIEALLAAFGLWIKGNTANKAYQKLLDKNQQNKKFGYNSSKLFEVFFYFNLCIIVPVFYIYLFLY